MYTDIGTCGGISTVPVACYLVIHPGNYHLINILTNLFTLNGKSFML